jgi:hypothetical protein
MTKGKDSTMAAYKLNLARIRGCPPAKELTALMEKWGLPDGQEFGILQCGGTEATATGELVRLEVWPTRKTRVVLEKRQPSWLMALHPGSSFFYTVEVNNRHEACTPDPLKARQVFRDCCRFACKA